MGEDSGAWVVVHKICYCLEKSHAKRMLPEEKQEKGESPGLSRIILHQVRCGKKKQCIGC